MIKIEATSKNGKITNLTVKGHANSATTGHDLVCAAVSSVVTGGLNALTNPDCFAIKLEKGDVEVNEKKHASEHDYDVLNTVLVQLKTIAETDSKYVEVIEKGN